MDSFDANLNDSDIRFNLNGKQVIEGAPPNVEQGHVKMNFGNLLPMLEEAISSQRVWVKDFADEEIRVSTDLFDVIQAFRYFNNEQPG